MSLKYFFITISTIFFFQICLAKIDLDFSTTRGFYNSPFSLYISADQPNTIVKYTTDGSIPSITNGSQYNGAISISTTTTLRVFAYNTTDQSNVRTHSYLFYEGVQNQPNTKNGFPDSGFAFDGSILNNNTYANQLSDALLQIGTISVVVDLNEFNGVYNGVLEKPASAEFIIPSTGEHKQEDCGIERFGGSSFNSHKRNFRLSFKSVYGAEKLSFPLFNENVVNKFDQLALRAGHAGCINNEANTLHTGESNDLADQVVRDLQINMSKNKVGVAGNFMHLYINGIYWGVYNVTERPVDGWAQKYFGGEKEDYDVVKQKTALKGNINDWNTLVNFSANNNLANNSNYQTIKNYIDIENFIDYILVSNYAPHSDNHSSAKNSYANKNRTLNEGFRFWIWDTEPAFDYYWPPNWSKDHIGSRPFDTIYTALLANEDFVMQTADQMHCHCFNNGALTPNKVTETYMQSYNATEIAMIAEAGRWASSTAYQGFINAKDRIVNNYLPVRTTETINNYKNAGYYPNLSAVNFNQYGGELASGASISLTNPNGNGSIKYTIDRSDPRGTGGVTAATAQTYNGSFNLPNGIHVVKARIKQNSKWSAMCPRKFYVGQNYAGLVINEIHYNPKDSIFFNPIINAIDTVSGRNFEFIELKNTSNQAVYLEDVHFNKGITLIFDANVIIPANGFVVIAEDAYWFQKKYGFTPDATYNGKLDNSGENLWMLDPYDNIIDTLKYNDNLPWDTIPDNGIYSLALLNSNLDNAKPNHWTNQNVAVSPKAENTFCEPIQVNYTKIDVSCNGKNDGFVLVNTTGGRTPHSYNWSSGELTANISNIAAGNYIITVTDTINCSVSETITIAEPPAMVSGLTALNETYFQANNGSATLNVSGGIAPYIYSWSSGANTSSVSNLSPGNYSVTVTDANNCSLIENFIVEAIDCSGFSLSTTKTNETYFEANDGTANVIANGIAPYTYSWSSGAVISSITNLTPSVYTIVVEDAVGCIDSSSLTIEAVDCSTFAATINKTDQTYYQTNDGTATVNILNGINPFVYNWSNGQTTSNVSNLAPGAYSVNVTDGIGCPINKSIIINPIFCEEMVVNATTYNETCLGQFNGLIVINNISNGAIPLSILWSTGNTGTVANNLTSGSYQLLITDLYGCPFSKTYEITASSIISASVNATNVSSATINDGAIDLSVSGGISPYSFSWSNNAITEDVDQLTMGNYTVQITDANNCKLEIDNLLINNDCMPNFIQLDALNINSGVYQVSDFIQCNGNVQISENVSFKANTFIDLLNDFEVIKGAEFEAIIDGCE